jgi:hypothetical protein
MRLDAVLPFTAHGLPKRQTVGFLDRLTIGSHGRLREPGYFCCHRLGLRSRASGRDHSFAHADLQRFASGDLAAGQYDFHGSPLADQPWKADRPAIQEGDSPAPAVDAEVGVFGHDAHIAPQRQFHATGNRRPLDGRDDRF